MEEKRRLGRLSKTIIACLVWSLTVFFGFMYEHKVPINWVFNVSEVLWNISRIFPGENAAKTAINLIVAHWLVSRCFFAVYFAGNIIVFSLFVAQAKITRLFFRALLVVYILHSMLDTFGLLTLKDLSWNSYWVYKIFSFSTNPIISLFAIVFYRVATKIQQTEQSDAP